MALGFKVETLKDSVRFHVKGMEVELSYHAASHLCNTIIDVCLERLESNSSKCKWWLLRAKQGFRCNVRESNKKDYEDFLKANGIDIDSLQESPVRHKKQAGHKPKRISREERIALRKAAQKAKVEALRQRHHIPTKEVNP